MGKQLREFPPAHGRHTDRLVLVEETFGGECSKREIKRLKGIAEREGASVVVGVGGGKTMDTAKAVGHEAGAKWALHEAARAQEYATRHGVEVLEEHPGV